MLFDPILFLAGFRVLVAYKDDQISTNKTAFFTVECEENNKQKIEFNDGVMQLWIEK